MRKLANAKQMKQIDRYSIDEIGIPSLVLMERAALSVAMAIDKAMAINKATAETEEDGCLESAKRKNKILAVCGVGNNGADGVAALRSLKGWGYEGAVLLMGKEEKASQEMEVQLSIARKLGIPVMGPEEGGRLIGLPESGAFGQEEENKKGESEYTIIIDALFGIGLSKPVEGSWRRAIEAVNAGRRRGSFQVFAVDIPSGIHASTGKVMGAAIEADCTVTFGVGKLGLALYPGCRHGGKVVTADIGFPEEAIEKAGIQAFCYEKADVARLLPKRQADSNKGTYGRVLVVGGSKNMAGACYLSAKAAYRTGAGLVKVMTEEANRQIVQTLLPEALLFTYEEEGISEQRDAIQKEMDWATVIILGPGLGKKASGRLLLELALERAKVPVILDADGLNLLAEGEGIRKVLEKPNFVLTPHLKEMSRLTGDAIEAMKEDMVAYAMGTMEGAKGVLVLKDSRTVVTDGKSAYVNLSGNSGMAKGGSGDALTGIIGGLLAQGMDALAGSCLGVYLHGLAGDRAARERSEYSLLAGDLTEGLEKEIKEHERVPSDCSRD